MYLQKVISKKTLVDVLKVTDENSRIRIHNQTSQSFAMNLTFSKKITLHDKIQA
jgi:hypothetical protein